MFVSLAFRGHATPLLRIAAELARRGRHRVSFATHDEGRAWVAESVPALRFVSAGPMPLGEEALERRLRVVSKDRSSVRGLLALANEVYVPTAQLHSDSSLSVSWPRSMRAQPISPQYSPQLLRMSQYLTPFSSTPQPTTATS